MHTETNASQRAVWTDCVQTGSDNKCAMFFKDQFFLEKMEKEVQQNKKNNWVAPPPFKSPLPLLPDSKVQVLSRLCGAL